MIYKTTEELMEKVQEAEGKTFGEIDTTGRLSNKRSKGGLGQVIEESFFGYKINSDARPDFEELGIELKVTPFKHNKNGTVSAKERLVLNIINYMEEVHTTFTTSSFWKKNEKLLLMFYEWVQDNEPKDFSIYKSILFTYPASDLEIIKQDWMIIVEKIRAGKAHELSEGDTNYLGACPKGANKNSLRDQPYSDERAMQRAFALKQSYMTAILRKYIFGEELVSFTSYKELQKKSISDLLAEKFAPFTGMTDEEMSIKLDVPYAKALIPMIISALLGIKGTKLNQIEEFAKANIQFKTIRLEPNGKPKESMSFEKIDFTQWIQEPWEDSFLRHKFLETKFLFVVFEYKETLKENKNRKLYFKGIKLWNMPLYTVENEMKQLYLEVNKVLSEGIKIEYVQQKNGTIVEKNNFPKSNFNGVSHIRPKAADGKDKVMLPSGERITKQCYWLNREYIGEIVKDLY